jgi:hypothetical protein
MSMMTNKMKMTIKWKLPMPKDLMKGMEKYIKKDVGLALLPYVIGSDIKIKYDSINNNSQGTQ